MRYFLLLLILFFMIAIPVQANLLPDRDLDMVPDKDEIEIYKTDPDSADTDNDGFSDWMELVSGYSPHSSEPIKLEDSDLDEDGLSDRMELNFHTNLKNKDTDADGFSDGVEVDNYYDPLKNDGSKLQKKIEVDLSSQKLHYYLGDVRMGTYIVSTGKPGMHTPKGHFEVDGKHLRAWSSLGLWMPYWMSLQHGYFGIHELPEWPNGSKEGEDHLGKPVSHGCIRLGVGPAEHMYNWADVGTPVYIY